MADVQALSLSRLLKLVSRRRRLFLWTTLTTLAAVVAFVMGLPDVYRSSATLLVQGQLPEVVEQPTAAATVDGRLQIIKQQALSRARLTELLNEFDLYGYSSGRKTLEQALDRLQKDLRVEATTDQTARPGAQTIAFRVSYVGTSPQTSADVANALASFFVAQNDEMRTAHASNTAEFLGAELAKTRKILDAQEARARSFSARNSGVLPQQIEANIAAINRLDAQLRLNDAEQTQLVQRRQTLKNEIAALDSAVPPETDTSPQATEARLVRELADLRLKFGDNYPDVRIAQNRLEAFRRSQPASAPSRGAAPASTTSRKAVLQQALAETESQIERAAAEDKAVKAQIDEYQGRVERAPAGAPAFDGVMKDYQATRDQFDALQKQYNAAMLNERAERRADTQEFRVLDQAVPPLQTAGPTRVVLLTLAVFLAVIVGATVLLARDHSDDSFHSVDDLRQFTHVPVLASIPVMARPEGVVRRARNVAIAGAALVAIGVIAQAAFNVAQASDQVSRLLSRVM